ncbi:hypothetical protein KO481_22050 [Nocardia sp. NEAU-G5]|uniref:Uncharacterized protein n=1 Tax=Nocardia albiluteola TaxID=2842303 RepID=A0ABS6B1N3_9NOCA|nr:hypothetical protein [Nocardia albiluteola]MBU3064204.1 hypothetical protein [Nocardia albiluteola]
MKTKLFGTLFVATAAGALLVAPAVGSALAEAPMPAHQQSNESPDWGGYNNPGWRNPHNDDWRCDRHGNWHNDQHDQWGRPDGRCHTW